MALPGFKTTTTTRSVILDAAVQLVFMRLDGKYPTNRLDKIATISSGGTPTRGDSTLYGGDIPWAKIGDITAAGKWISETEENITQIAIEQSSAKLFPIGTVFFSMYASIGKTSIAAQPMATNQAILGLIPNSGIQPEYLYYALINARAKLFSQSKGTSQKNINGGMVKEFAIPLPPPDEIKKIVEYLSLVEEGKKTDTLQNLPDYLRETRCIVARIEALARRIAEAQSLRREASEETDILVNRSTSHDLDEQNWNYQRLETVLVESPRNGLAPQEEVESNGKKMLRINAVSSSPTRYVDLSAYKLVKVDEEIAKPFFIQHDDVFIVRYNGDINRVAKAAIYKTTDVCKFIYPDKLMRLRVDQKVMLPDFLVYALSSRKVRAQVEEIGKTTAGQIGVSGTNAKAFVVPVPPLEEQRRLVTYLDHLQAQVSALRTLQDETQKELDASMPSILDKAFKGEL